MLDYEPRRASNNFFIMLACAIALNRAPAQAQDEIDATPTTTLEDHSERERLGPKKTDKKARDLFDWFLRRGKSDALDASGPAKAGPHDSGPRARARVVGAGFSRPGTDLLQPLQ